MTNYNPQNPLIVQGDKTVLLGVDNVQYAAARDVVARFAELEKSPAYVHPYCISPLSLWNAAAAGLDAAAILVGLARYAKYPVPGNVRVDIADAIARYGRVKLIKRVDQLLLTSTDHLLITELSRRKELKPYILAQLDPATLLVNAAMCGHIKHALVQIGYPAEDLAGCLRRSTGLGGSQCPD